MFSNVMIDKVLPRFVRQTRFKHILQQTKPWCNNVNTKIEISTMTDMKEPSFMGLQMNFTDKLQFFNKENYNALPIFRILNSSKQIQLPKEYEVNEQTLIKMYNTMLTLSIMDKILYESQRQGRISFYMTSTGEEALQIGSAAALTLEDIVYAQYREAGVLLWRGYSLMDVMNQCYGNHKDPGKGKQMSVHYGSKKLNFVTISSPLTTQLPQAVGTAYALKQSKTKSCVACYFGEGAASEGDAHAAFNFAATLECPVIFIWYIFLILYFRINIVNEVIAQYTFDLSSRNNGYAISTPTLEQFKGDGIAARGPAYGIHSIRVDGNDTLAMYNVMKAARQFCIEEGKPVLIEAMTYRVGHHSTSDDSTRYRSDDEVAQWNCSLPIGKFRNYLESINLWCEKQEQESHDSIKKSILHAFTCAEKELKPCWKELFTDVYHTMPKHIKKQLSSMEDHVNEFHEYYPLESFKST